MGSLHVKYNMYNTSTLKLYFLKNFHILLTLAAFEVKREIKIEFYLLYNGMTFDITTRLLSVRVYCIYV